MVFWEKMLLPHSHPLLERIATKKLYDDNTAAELDLSEVPNTGPRRDAIDSM